MWLYKKYAALILHEVNVSQFGFLGVLPLKESASKGHLPIVEYLVQNDADVNQTQKGVTALFISAVQGHVAIVEFLLNNGANINQKTLCGKTPLAISIKEGHEKVTELLRARGAV